MNLIPKDERFGYYEKRLCFLLFLSAIPNAFQAFTILITLFTPPYRCAMNDMKDLWKEQIFNHSKYSNEEQMLEQFRPSEQNELGEQTLSRCTRYNASNSMIENLPSFATPSGNTTVTVVPCFSIEFLGNEMSAITEFELVCKNARMKPMLSSLMFMGAICGSLVGGFFSDRYGRRLSFLLFTAWQCLVTLLLSFSPNPAWYGMFTFLLGVGGLLNYVSASLIGTEMLPTKLRSFSYFCLGMGFAVGYMLIALLAYGLIYWRWFLRVTALIEFFYLPYYWLLDETPQWLLASGRSDEAQKVLQKISNMNAKETTTIKEIQKELSQRVIPLSLLQTAKKLLKEPILLKRFMIEGLGWCIVGFGYYAVALSVNSLNGNRFLNLFYSALMEVASILIYYTLVRYRGRCGCYIITMGLCSISVAATGLLQTGSPSAIVVTTMFSKLMLGTAFAVLYIHSPEIFPTKIRQTCIGCVAAWARIGAFVAPYIIFVGEDGNVLGPSLGTAGAIIVSCALYAFLPETQKSEMPQTVQEAVDMKSFASSICNRKDSDSKEKDVEEIIESLV